MSIEKETTMWGWSFDQWAIASGRYTDCKSTDANDVLALKKLWNKRNITQPGEVKIIGVEIPRNLEYAIQVFQIACSFPYAYRL
jgi:hypothetical protein